MATPFETFVNGELPKRVSTEAPPLSWTNGQVLTTTGVGLAVEAVDTNTLGFEPAITGSGVATEFWNGNKVFTSVTATSIGAIPTSEKGVADGVATLDVGGKIPLSQIPAAAVERVVIVADETARFALTTATVQQGDVVDQQSPKAIYFVVDDAELDNAAGYSELVAGIAAAVAWSGVTGIPIIISDIAGISGSVDGDILQKVSGTWVNRTTTQLKTSLAIETSDVSGLTTALGLKADLESPTFTGTVTIPTAIAGDSSTAAANTAFVAGEISTNAQPKDATLTALAAYNTNGIVVQTAADTFAGRSLAAGQGITILNPSAVAANPTISITDTAVTPGTYGSLTEIPVLAINSRGQITDASTVTNGVFSDNTFRIRDNSDVTKQIAFEASNISTGTTKTITIPNQNVTLGSIPAYANTTVYTVGAEVTYLGVLYICNILHTSASATPDFTKFYPASGILVTTVTGGTYTPPVNSNIQEYRVFASASIDYTSNVVIDKPITFINTTTTGSITITGTPNVLEEGNLIANPLVLGTGDAAVLLGAVYNKVSASVASNLFKIRKPGSNTSYANFNTAALTTNRSITIPDANVNLGRIPASMAYSTAGVLTVTNADATTLTATIKRSSTNISGSTTLVADGDHFLLSLNGVTPVAPITLTTPFATSAGSRCVIYTMGYAGVINLAFASGVGFTDALGNTISSIDAVPDSVITITPYQDVNSGIIVQKVSIVYGKFRPMGVSTADAVFCKPTNSTIQSRLNLSALTASRTLTLPDCDVNLGRIVQTMLVPAGQTVGAGAYIWPYAALAAGVIPRIVITSGDITIDTDGVSGLPVNVLVTNVTSATRTVSLAGFVATPYDALGTVITSFTLAAGRSAELAFKVGGGSNFKVLEVAKFTSAEFRVGDSTTPTKQMALNLSAISSSTTRTWTAPNADINFGRVTAYTNTATAITVTASPFTRTNPSAFADEDIIVEGGTVSLIEFSRNGSTWYNVGSVAGMYRLSPSDRLRVTYTVAPTMTSIPR